VCGLQITPISENQQQICQVKPMKAILWIITL
jgi:hypothetical protein